MFSVSIFCAKISIRECWKYTRLVDTVYMAGPMEVDVAKLWKIIKTYIWQLFRLHFLRDNLAARMLKIHTTRKYVLLAKPFQVIFYQPVCFAKIMAGKYIGDFCVIHLDFSRRKSNRAIWKPRRPDIEEITAHLLAGTILPGKLMVESSSWNMVGPMGVGETEF